MITISQLNKKVNNVLILNDINLKFRKNEMVCILGPSGSGKTTLLNVIGKIDSYSSGDIYFGKNNINIINDDFYHNRIVSFVFQDYNLINNLNINDNLKLPLKVRKEKYNINRVLKMLNLDNVSNNINNLSGGEKQRIAIGRCLVSDTDVILADEPTGALDSCNSENIMKILKNISKKKLIIMVTHNEILAKKYADRIIKIKDGNIISDSNPYNYECKVKLDKTKARLSFKDILKLSVKNLLSKKKRVILTILAFSITLLSLLLIFGIKNGFKNEIDEYEKNSLYSYPLVISKEGISLNTNIDGYDNNDKSRINIIKDNSIVRNNIDNNSLKQLDLLDKKLIKGITYNRCKDVLFSQNSYVLLDNSYFNLIEGSYINKKDEVLLLIDSNYGLSEYAANMISLSSSKFNEAIGKKVKVLNKELKVVGVVYSDDEYFSGLNGFLYKDGLFEGEILDIFIYPRDYYSKTIIKDKLSNFNVIDNASSVISLSKSLADGITYVLVGFCLISVLVSYIMISVITYISVIEKTKDIGILKSLGIRKKDIKKIFIYENNMVGIISSFVAIIVAYILGNIINHFSYEKIGFESICKININMIIVTVLFSIIITFLSSYFPAKKASKIKIIDTFRYK